MSEIIIIAPHPDDETIGCYSILSNPNHEKTIVFTEPASEERIQESSKLIDMFNIKEILFCLSMPPKVLKKENLFYFPGPDELHPAHRKMAMLGEEMARQGYHIIFYSTNMNVKNIFEVKDPEAKKNALNTLYPSQSDLWKYQHKFFLFEAYTQWFF